MALDPASMTSRSNSDVLKVIDIATARQIDPDVRAEMILHVMRDWDRATVGSTGRFHSIGGALDRLEKHLYPYA